MPSIVAIDIGGTTVKLALVRTADDNAAASGNQPWERSTVPAEWGIRGLGVATDRLGEDHPLGAGVAQRELELRGAGRGQPLAGHRRLRPRTHRPDHMVDERT